MMNSIPTYNSNIVNFKVNPYYSNLFMKNNLFDISTVLSTLALNGYTIFEIINSYIFPIILATGSLILTGLLIIVQVRKMKLVSQQLKSECIETEKKGLELKILQEEVDDHDKQIK